MAILAAWVCLPGIRRTTSGAVHDLSVRCAAHGGVDRVEFAVTANGSPHSTLTASARSVRRPNFSAQQSRWGGVPSGMKPFPGYGVGLDLSSVPAGTISVVATVFDNGGNSYELPDPMVVYNDTDGTDRRPRQVDVYVRGETGSDGNDGLSWATAVQSTGRALELATGPGNEAGGARIHYREAVSDVSGGNYPKIRTSGYWWVEHIADTANGGCFIGAPDAGGLPPRTFSTGDDDGTPTTATRHRFIGFDWHPASLVCYVYAGVAHLWVDGGQMEAIGYLGAGRWSVRYAIPDVGAAGSFFGPNGPGSVQRYFTGVRVAGAVLGFEQHKLLYDCAVEQFIGIAAKVGSLSTQVVCGGLRMQGERYESRAVEGYVRMDSSGSGHGRPALTVTKPTGTTARISGPTGGYDFSIDAAALVGQTYWGLRFEDSGSVGLDTGSAALVVTAVGNDGGAPWVEVTAPSASAGSVPADTCSFYTARVTTGANYWFIHPDGIQLERFLSRDAIFDCGIADAPNLQSFFTSGHGQELTLWSNLRDDGSGLNDFNWNSSSGSAGATWYCLDSILENITCAGQLQSSYPDWTGTLLINCTFGSAGNETNQIETRGGTVTHCHWISGAPVGSDATTGSWFESDPTEAPFSMEPADARKGTGSPDVEDLAEWRYSDAGSTRGALPPIAELDWSVPESGTGTSASVSTTLSIDVTAAASTSAPGGGGPGEGITASVSTTLSIAVQATAITSGGEEPADGITATVATTLAIAVSAAATTGSGQAAAADPLAAAIARNAQGPLEVEGDSGRVRQHGLQDQIDAHRYLASKRAVRSRGLGLNIRRGIPPGTT